MASFNSAQSVGPSMTERGEDASLPLFPPEWVPLADLPGWVARIYNVDAVTVAFELIPAVRDRVELRHRVPGIKANHSSMYKKSLPNGLSQEGSQGSPVRANDWEAAEADWISGTVGGWGEPGARERLPIEVSWGEAKSFVDLRVRRWEKVAKRDLGMLETRRAERIGGFREQQRLTRDWIEIEVLVKFLALPKGPNRNVNAPAKDWFSDLKSSFEQGEFNVRHKAQILFLCPGQWAWGRLTRQRLADLPDDDHGHSAWLQWCWVPRDLLAKWLRHRDITFPQHMLPAGGENDREKPHAAIRDPEEKRIKYNHVKARVLLAAAKFGEFRDRIPTEDETSVVLRRHFLGVSNDRHRAIRKEFWPENRSGPRRRTNSAE